MPYKTTRARRRTQPNWPAVQRGENEGRTLADLWRDYAATAENPYHVIAFHHAFRKWQSTEPDNPPEEFAASDRYWEDKLWRSRLVKPDILILDERRNPSHSRRFP